MERKSIRKLFVFAAACLVMLGMTVSAGYAQWWTSSSSTSSSSTSSTTSGWWSSTSSTSSSSTSTSSTSSSSTSTTSSSSTSSGGILPSVSSIETDGPFATTIDKYSGSRYKGWVVRPSTLGSQGVSKHPIFVWGPGAGSGPSDYETYLRRWASHGFVVYCEESTGDGTEMTAAINWLTTQNSRSSSKYYNKLDLSRLAAGGHSRGSLSTFAIGSDSRLKTTIHVAGGSFDGNGSSSLRKPAMYIVGTADTMALPNVQTDYNNTKVAVWFGTMSGVDHIYATREGTPAITAWLRWQIADETSRKSMFIGSNCYFCSGMWSVKYKNW